MSFKLEHGLKNTSEYVVEEKDSAEFLGSGDVNVLSTPAMIAMMENTARLAVEDKLPSGYTTVGTRVNIAHIAPAPVGAKIKIIAELIKQEDRRLVFRVEAYWGDKKIGEGTHERYIVNKERFLSKVRSKK